MRLCCARAPATKDEPAQSSQPSAGRKAQASGKAPAVSAHAPAHEEAWHAQRHVPPPPNGDARAYVDAPAGSLSAGAGLKTRPAGTGSEGKAGRVEQAQPQDQWLAGQGGGERAAAPVCAKLPTAGAAQKHAEGASRVSTASSGGRGPALPLLLSRTLSVESYASARSSLGPGSPVSPRIDGAAPFDGADAGVLSPRILACHDALHAGGAGAHRPLGAAEPLRTPRGQGAAKLGGLGADPDDLGSRAPGVAGALLDRTPLQERRLREGRGSSSGSEALEGADSLEAALPGAPRAHAPAAAAVGAAGAASAAAQPRASAGAGALAALPELPGAAPGGAGEALGAPLAQRRVSATLVRTVGPGEAAGEPVGWVRSGSLSRVSRVRPLGPARPCGRDRDRVPSPTRSCHLPSSRPRWAQTGTLPACPCNSVPAAHESALHVRLARTLSAHVARWCARPAAGSA